MIGEPYMWMAALLLAWALLMWLPTSGGSTPLSIAEIGFLRRGPRGALRTAITARYVNSLVAIQRRAVMRGEGPKHAGVGALGQAVYETAASPVPLALLRFRPRIRRALTDTRDRPVSEGLVPGRARWLSTRAILLAVAIVAIYQLRGGDSIVAWLAWLITLGAVIAAWFIPRRTLAGYRRLAALRRGEGEIVTLTQKRVPTESVRQDAVVAFALDAFTPPGLVGAFSGLLARRSRSQEGGYSYQEHAAGHYRLARSVGRAATFSRIVRARRRG